MGADEESETKSKAVEPSFEGLDVVYQAEGLVLGEDPSGQIVLLISPRTAPIDRRV